MYFLHLPVYICKRLAKENVGSICISHVFVTRPTHVNLIDVSILTGETNSMEQRYSKLPDSLSDSEEISRFICILKDHYNIHSPQLDYMNTANTLTGYIQSHAVQRTLHGKEKTS
jgi:hypothetical protein